MIRQDKQKEHYLTKKEENKSKRIDFCKGIRSSSIGKIEDKIMDDELENFIKVWSLAFLSFCYCFYVSAKLPKGLFRLISLLPIFFLFLILPLHLSSFHFCGPTSFFLTWLANFKLLLFCFDQGPLISPSPPTLFHFISVASLPIKIKTKSDPKPALDQNHLSINSFVPKSSLLAVKVLLLAILIHSYNYKQHFNKHFIFILYGIHTYLELEVILAMAALPARTIFGIEIEPQFNEPYLATSLQDFWGRRWNLMVTSILRPTVYHPIRRISARIIGPQWCVSTLPAVLAVFAVSGLMHELIYYYVTRVYPTWEVTWFFILHGLAVATEVAVKKAVPEKLRLHPAVSGPLVLGFVAVTGIWLFLPQLVRNRVDERAIAEFYKLADFIKINVLSLLPSNH